MRVSYDPQTFLRQRTGGISRLFVDLIREFDNDSSLNVEATLPLRFSNNFHLEQELPNRRIKSTPGWLPRGALYAPWWLNGKRIQGGAEIVHRTYYSPRFLGTRKQVKQAVTVYDMIPELFADSEYFTATHLAKKRYVQECDLVICISESTKQDMLSIYGDIGKNVVVIPLAVRPGFGELCEPLPQLPNEYLLYVGSRKGYKDFSLLPRALELLKSEGIEIPLVLVGPQLEVAEIKDFQNRGLGNSVMSLQLSDKDLRRAYAHCSLLVQTSRYEGFGLTPLEGMASGVPVVASNSSSMPEVGGDVVQYFKPGDADNLAKVLLQVLTDEILRADLASKGPLRASKFTTRNMAKSTSQAYFDLLNQ